ncbi:helix-turn-helix domain-containing protein [Mucilaginibacter agri]|uniref:Helix-turn-helix domain-containing protein n=1 Tax=Mucilaginibacter agri TaxID=2695265 RepID=A0A965ZBR4_9SPHI|nr:helix-turn-helix transcriptional regulator [Mucilaginibacter agri]NCD68103.1 helix-turn-helix domain-containing protein [Mucilaginibacter agri]
MSSELKISAIEQHVIKYVTDLRNEKNLTQDDIATIIGVSRSFINNIESNKSRAKYNLTHIDKLADHFGLSPKDFLPAVANKHL